MRIDRKTLYLFVFIGTVILGFIYLTSPSFPSLYPLGNIADGPRHFALAQYIQENGHLVHDSIYELTSSGSGVMDTYPFGMHLNMALLSSMLGVPLIKFIFPFNAFIVALTAGALYGISVEVLKLDKGIAICSPFFFLTSLHVMDALTYQNSYSTIFAGFLALVFFWVLSDYSKKTDYPKLLFLALLETAMVFSYPFWALITLAAFLANYLFFMEFEEKRMHLAILVSASTLLTIYFWWDKFFVLKLRMQEIGIVPRGIIATTGKLLILLAVIGFFPYKKDRQTLYTFFLAVVVIPLILFFSSIFGFRSTSYWYYKTLYFLEYPLVLFACLGLEKIVKYSYHKSASVQKDNNSIKYYVMLFLLATSVTGIVYLRVSRVEKDRWRSFSVTPEEYEIAKWMNENIPTTRILYFDPDPEASERPFIFWILTVSRHSIGEGGDIILLKNINEIPYSMIVEFKPAYKSDNINLLVRRK
ncbi:MAG: hypothetical protein ACE5J5_01020 [Candidatus Hydrothermarchaeales archaeon]